CCAARAEAAAAAAVPLALAQRPFVCRRPSRDGCYHSAGVCRGRTNHVTRATIIAKTTALPTGARRDASSARAAAKALQKRSKTANHRYTETARRAHHTGSACATAGGHFHASSAARRANAKIFSTAPAVTGAPVHQLAATW